MNKICFVTETYPPDINGVALTLEKIINGFVLKNYSVSIITPKSQRSDNQQSSGLSIPITFVKGFAFPFYREARFGLPCRSLLYKSWSVSKPDLVHIATEGPLGYSALCVANDLNIPVVSDFRTNFHEYGKYYGIGKLRKLIFLYLRYFHNKTDRTLVPTKKLAEFLQKSKFAKISVVPRGVDINLFHPRKRNPKTKRTLSFEDDSFNLLSVGRLAKEKNLDLVIDVFFKFRKISNKVMLIFVGDGPYIGELKERCPDALFVGYKTASELSEYYANADLLVFPSLTETFGNVTLEALASGLPVLSFDTAAAKELVIDGKNGFTVNVFQDKAFVEKAIQIFDHVDLGNIRKNARRTAEQNCWDQIIRRTEKEFMDVFNVTKK